MYVIGTSENDLIKIYEESLHYTWDGRIYDEIVRVCYNCRINECSMILHKENALSKIEEIKERKYSIEFEDKYAFVDKVVGVDTKPLDVDDLKVYKLSVEEVLQ